MTERGSAETRRLLLATLGGSALFAGGLFWAFFRFNSQLAFAQAADSLLDIATAAMLLWTVALAARPEDSNHPFGHHRAEPLGGLVVAVLAGAMAIEVLQSAGQALLGGESASIDAPLLWLFGGKAAFKTGVIVFASRGSLRTRSPALQALKVDARNDALTSVVAIFGALASRWGSPSLDAWLALPMAAWILWSGVTLARENVSFLMGEAPSEQRQQELVAIASSTAGVLDAHDLKAHYLGTLLQLTVHIVVSPDITVKEAHDIGEAARERLEREEDVGYALMHVDIE